MPPPTRNETERTRQLNALGDDRSPVENDELQMLWLRRWIWKVQQGFTRVRNKKLPPETKDVRE